jgi:hypothetical protein
MPIIVGHVHFCLNRQRSEVAGDLRHGANAGGLDGAFGRLAMARQPLAAIFQRLIGMCGQKLFHFGFDGLSLKLAGA